MQNSDLTSSKNLFHNFFDFKHILTYHFFLKSSTILNFQRGVFFLWQQHQVQQYRQLFFPLIKFNHWIKPLHIITPCAKSWLPFVDVGAKIPAIFAPVKNHRQYVVIEKSDSNPFSIRLDLANWEQWLDKSEALAHWILSLCQCETVCRKLNNEPARWSTVASLVSPLISAKLLYTEGSFLYKALLRDQYVRAGENGKGQRTVTANLAKQEIYGAGFKIALSIICLSLDLFNRFAPKGDKSGWLETALFWTSLAPTFVGPAAHYYMPELVVKPLQTRAGIR